MTRYVGDWVWLDVDETNVTIGSLDNQSSVVMPLAHLLAAQVAPDVNGGVLTMIFKVPGHSRPHEVTVEFGPQVESAFRALGAWLDEVVAFNRH